MSVTFGPVLLINCACWSDFVLLVIRTIHKPVLEQVLPFMIILPLDVTVTPIPIFLNTRSTLHPALYIVKTGMSEYDDITAMTWPDHAAFDNSGRVSYCVWDDLIFGH